MNSPGVWFPPPGWLAIGFGLGWLLETHVYRLHVCGGGQACNLVVIAGWAFMVGGVLLAMWGMITFKRARTAIIPHNPATRIVQSGPYRFTRNPMYVGFTYAYVGGALVLDMIWPLILLLPSLWALRHFVIDREEQYLTSAFGAEYDEYRARVRRWI